MNLLSVEVTMTSLEVVDLINKFREDEGHRAVLKHKSFMQSIRTELESLANAGIEVGEQNILPAEYIDSQGKKRPCYRMNRFWIMLMCNKESALVRYKTQQYIEALEQALQDLKFRHGDKKHQLECMALLQDMLPDDVKQEKINYIKANTVVDKAVSNYFGFPKMIKKIEMNKDMLEVRESVLNDYLKLFEVLQDNHEVKEVLYKKYAQPKLIEGDA